MKLKTKLLTKKYHGISYYAFTLLLAFIVCKGTLVVYTTAFLRKLSFFNIIAPFFAPTLLLLLSILAYKKSMCRYLRARDLLIIAFVIMSILLTMIFYPENEQYFWENFEQYIIYCIPAFLIGLLSVEYDENMFKVISIVSCVSLIASFFLLFYYKNIGITLSGDELGQSYAVLPSSLFIISYFCYKKSKIYFTFSIIGIIYALMLGSRGPIILLFVFLAINWILKNKKRWYIVCCVAIFVYFFLGSEIYLDCLQTVRCFLLEIGYSTRIIDLALANKLISHDSGRNDLYIILLNLLDKRPLLGYGLFGEWQFIGWNAHHLYLEIVFEYGWPLGVILIVAYLIKIFTTFIYEKDDVARSFMVIFIVFVLIQGFKSYSHLRPELFLLLGFCIKQRRMQKRKIKRITLLGGVQ